MADGGASSFIMLVTALLISGSVSAILITEWSDATQRIKATEQKGAESSDYAIAFAGDPMMVSYDSATSEITFYIQNIGSGKMSTAYEVKIDGATPTTVTDSILPSGATWLPGHLLELTASPFTYQDGDDVSLLFIGLSETSTNGHVHSRVVNEEVRLNAI